MYLCAMPNRSQMKTLKLLGTGVITDSFEPPYRFWELNLDPLEEQPFLTTEPSFQLTNNFLFVFFETGLTM